MLNHWDNVAVHPVMGQVERGYAGGSIFWRDGRSRGDLARVREYGRLLASSGINAISVNNVNVARMGRCCSPTGSATSPRSRTCCARTASGCTCRSASPRRWSSVVCRPPTRWTRPCDGGGPRPPGGCTSASPTSAATW
ncbi:hypothetical protein NKG94_06850 [Micromonospora sp. M12]